MPHKESYGDKMKKILFILLLIRVGLGQTIPFNANVEIEGYLDVTNDLIVATNLIYADSSKGMVGIGTTSVDATLDVVANIAGNVLEVTRTGGTDVGSAAVKFDSDGDMALYINTTGDDGTTLFLRKSAAGDADCVHIENLDTGANTGKGMYIDNRTDNAALLVTNQFKVVPSTGNLIVLNDQGDGQMIDCYKEGTGHMLGMRKQTESGAMIILDLRSDDADAHFLRLRDDLTKYLYFNKQIFYIIENVKFGLGTTSPDKLFGIGDGTDEYSFEVVSDLLTFYNDAGTPKAILTLDSLKAAVFKGSVTIDGALINSSESVTTQASAGTASLVDYATYVTSGNGGGVDVVSLADGVAGQEKLIVLISDGGDDIEVTPTNFVNGTKITMGTVGQSCLLHFDGTNWLLVSTYGGSVS